MCRLEGRVGSEGQRATQTRSRAVADAVTLRHCRPHSVLSARKKGGEVPFVEQISFLKLTFKIHRGRKKNKFL